MRWEYRTLIRGSCYGLMKGLNGLGRKGWEAFDRETVIYPYGPPVYIAYLKRPKR